MIMQAVLTQSGNRHPQVSTAKVGAQAEEQEQVEWAIWPIWRT
jgi:hypothetical protein